LVWGYHLSELPFGPLFHNKSCLQCITILEFCQA
jgi:hypothetical protein